MTPEWSAAALADLNRFSTFLEEHHPGLARIVAREIITQGANPDGVSAFEPRPIGMMIQAMLILRTGW